MKSGLRSFARLMGALVLCGIALQLYFIARIALRSIQHRRMKGRGRVTHGWVVAWNRS